MNAKRGQACPTATGGGRCLVRSARAAAAAAWAASNLQATLHTILAQL